jgi:hypothetical protein
MRRNVFRIERTGKHPADLFHDRHRHAMRMRKLQDRRNGCETLRRLIHLFDDLGKGVPLAEQPPRSVVAGERRLAGGDQVTEPGQPGQRVRPGAEGHGEVRHLHQAARDDRGLGVLAVTDAVDDADRHRDQILQNTAEFCADDIRVHKGPEVPVRRNLGDRLRRFKALG